MEYIKPENNLIHIKEEVNILKIKETACRLCLINTSLLINVCSEIGIKMNINTKIMSVFQVEILNNEKLPHSICHDCLERIDDFVNFYNKVQENQKSLNLAIEELLNQPQVSIQEELNSTDNWEEYSISLCDPLNSQLLSLEESELQTNDEINRTILFNSQNESYNKEILENDVDTKDILSDKVTDEKLDNDFMKYINNDYDKNELDIKSPMYLPQSDSELSEKEEKPVIINKLKKKLKSKINSEIYESDEEDDKSEETKVPKLNHRIKLDSPIREFFDLNCTICDHPAFQTFTLMKKHMENKHNRIGYVTCCNKKLYRREAIMEHISYHLNPNQFDCPICKQNCKSRITLKIHMKQHIPEEERQFRCLHQECNQGFVLKSQLQSHEKSHYTNEMKKFVCDVENCGKAFAFKFVLEKHKQHMHIKEKNFMCEICARSFVDKVNLTAHKRTHFNLPRLQCQYCDARLKNKVTLKIHMRVHNPSVHTCNQCDKQLATQNALKNHILYVHGEKKHKCNICQKLFKKSLTLKEHMSIHTGEILYNCNYCVKTFNAKANMYSHIKKKHTKEWADAKRMKALNG